MLLSVRNLRTYFAEDDRVVKAVDGVSFDLARGETLGIVGESGSGKSVTNLSIMRLIPSPPGRIVGGEVLFGGVDLLKVSDAEMRAIRGKRIGMIFQDPMTSRIVHAHFAQLMEGPSCISACKGTSSRARDPDARDGRHSRRAAARDGYPHESPRDASAGDDRDGPVVRLSSHRR